MPLNLCEENRHQLLLLLDLEFCKFELNFFEVAHQHNQKFESWVHSEFSEHDWRRVESEFHLDIVDVKFFEVDLFLRLDFSTVVLFDITKRFFDFVNIIESHGILINKFHFPTMVISLVFFSLL